MNRKRRSFEDIWNFGFDDVFRALNEEFNLQSQSNKMDYRENGPITFGYSMRIGPDTNYQPEIRQWGNLNDYRQKKGLPEIDTPFFNRLIPQIPSESNKSDRFVDIIDEEDTLKIIVEVPGFTKENLNIEINEDKQSIALTGEVGNRKIDETISLPSKIEAKQTKSTIHNGVLEILVKKITKAEKRQKIKIE